MPQSLGYKDGVNLAISLCLTYTLCLSCVRAYIRKGAYGIDDSVIAVATVISFGHIGADYAALANGLGTPWSHIVETDSLTTLNTASVAGVVTFVVALYLSKCAMISFLGRITKTHSQVLLYKTCNVIVAVIGIVSLLAVTVDCPTGSGYYWAFRENKMLSCPSQSTRWQALTALDIATEILLLALPLQLVWNLQMPLAKKVIVITALYLRLPVIGFSIARDYYTLQLRLPGTDAGLTSGIVAIWLSVQLAYALASSTLSASKAFTESFNSGFGLSFARGKGENSYGLSEISSGKTPVTSKDEKSRTDSAVDGSTGAGTVQYSFPYSESLHGLDIPEPTAIPAIRNSSSTPLKLRPGPEIRTFTHVSADPELGPSRGNSSSNSEQSADDMVIVRETGYEVQHDRAPILRREEMYCYA
ncbi:hypothetical protein LTR37_000918 [Vermiconidia calcicola]|uniref:Uncharacterized protein n=1 Tax=Vermiconidia calcicola TaxID=1690605 RepID=A0ACC3NZ02_9PEZI|nr:hypothetical protein LTR37_000918 [Vermiconidia calcicola]